MAPEVPVDSKEVLAAFFSPLPPCSVSVSPPMAGGVAPVASTTVITSVVAVVHDPV